ncbi:MAG: hypothetical protein IT440_04775 [Phycisphaeraceae bacterium]|nr:hypothetical protein [Phycisphaeraceae bacterium]
MKLALHWIKANPIAVVAVFLCVGSLVSLFVVHAQGSAFVKRVQDRNSVVDQIQRLGATDVTLPSANLDQQARREKIAVNKAAITDLESIYHAMNDEYRRIFDRAVQWNHDRHNVLVPNLFPSPGNQTWLLTNARDEYTKALAEMFLYYTANAWYPRLNAGGPLPQEKLAQAIDGATSDYLSTIFPRKDESQLSGEQKAELAQRRRAAMLATLQTHASQIHIYAQKDSGQAEYPFFTGGWTATIASGGQPPIETVWEGQMELWVQQDIVQTLQDTNNVSDKQHSVLDAPIKRLIRIEPDPGYVGITSSGGFNTAGRSLNNSGEKKLPDDFTAAPTGRKSNTIYDVRHVRVHCYVDYQQLPDFFEQLSKINFMTVLEVKLSDVDEYEDLAKGYLYGHGDIVQASILIETLWLREWTAKLMPEGVQKQLGIVTRKPEQKDNAQRE